MLKLHSLSWLPGGESSGCIKAYASCVKTAFPLLTTRGQLLWLYRSLRGNDSTSLLIYSLSKHCPLDLAVSDTGPGSWLLAPASCIQPLAWTWPPSQRPCLLLYASCLKGWPHWSGLFRDAFCAVSRPPAMALLMPPLSISFCFIDCGGLDRDSCLLLIIHNHIIWTFCIHRICSCNSVTLFILYAWLLSILERDPPLLLSWRVLSLFFPWKCFLLFFGSCSWSDVRL